MNTNNTLQQWLPLLLGGMVALGMMGGYQLERHMNWRNRAGGPAGVSGSVQQVLDLINLKYIDQIALDSVEHAGIEAIVARLDPHSAYIPPSGMSQVSDELTGNFSGIGIEYLIINDTVHVTWVVENGPSDRAGLQVGDCILSVNDSLIAGKPITGEKLRGLLRGKPNSKVRVGILRQSQRIDREILRGSIPLPSLDAAYMIEPGVGFVRLNRFSETTFIEFMDATTRLKKEGMRQMILDLRGNGGGLMEEATKIADEFLPDGLKIVSTRGNHVKERDVFSTKPGIFEQGPLVVLLDEFSASASEVLAAALQENDRATIVGRRSFGKGLVQEQYNLANGGALRLTIARYYTPTGRSLQKPYANGNHQQYRSEIAGRFSNGQSNAAPDTTDLAFFTTRKGKRIYDMGGIMPEIVVPVDSTTAPPALVQLLRLPRLNDYIFSVYRDYRVQIIAFENPTAFANGYNLPDAAWKLLQEQAAADSALLGNISAGGRDIIANRVKALIARYHWRTQGYFEVINHHDVVVKKALEWLANI